MKQTYPCRFCKEVFNSFEKRKNHYKEGRICLSHEEMSEKGWRLINGVWHGKYIRSPASQFTPLNEGYDAEDIKILSATEQEERFGWVASKKLAKQYPWVAHDFIRRMLTACDLSGMDSKLAIRRYLDGDKAVEVTEDFVDTFKEISDQRGV